jgi:hypothetical protein
MSELHISGATYHGGFSFVAETSRAGRLVLTDEALTLDQIVHETLTRNFDPPIELCRTRAIASVEVTSEQVARSKVGAAVLFGVLGAVASKGASDRATMLVTLKSGETGYLTVDGQSTASLLGTLSPWLREHGIAPGPPKESAPSEGDTGLKLIADELAKLAELRNTAVISEDEFQALKSKLIADHVA